MTKPVNTFGKGALSLADSLGHTTGSRIIATRFRCPLCATYWQIETVGMQLPEPIAGDRLGAGLLCGKCEARRRIMFRGKDGLAVPMWTKADADRLWAIVLGARDRGENTFESRHKFADHDLVEGYQLRDDREVELRRILTDDRGRNRAAISEEGIRALGLDWKIPGCAA